MIGWAAKALGCSCNSAISCMAPGGCPHFAVVMEHDIMRAQHFRDKRNFFTIGLMREPCQYMLSEYTWGATGWGTGQPRDAAHTHPMGHLALDLHARGQGALYAPPHTKERFATWLRSRYVTAADAVAADGSPRCGLLSMRLYTQAANLSAAAAINPRGCGRDRASIVGRNGCPCPLARCAGAASAPVHAACHKALDSAPLPPFDCWLHTETLDTDFAACMRKYKERGGEVKNTDALCARNVQGNSSDAEKRCEAMHSPATAALLRHVDGGVYRRFGYTKCCGGRPSARAAADTSAVLRDLFRRRSPPPTRSPPASPVLDLTLDGRGFKGRDVIAGCHVRSQLDHWCWHHIFSTFLVVTTSWRSAQGCRVLHPAALRLFGRAGQMHRTSGALILTPNRWTRWQSGVQRTMRAHGSIHYCSMDSTFLATIQRRIYLNLDPLIY